MKLLIESGRRRVLVQNVSPEIDAGEFPVKRLVGQSVVVSVDALSDGHDQLSCRLKYRKVDEPVWTEASMTPVGNDRWQASFVVQEMGRYRYTVEAWVDRFKSWRESFRKRIDAGQPLAVELQVAAELVRNAAQRAAGLDAEQLQGWAAALSDGEVDKGRGAIQLGLSDRLSSQMAIYCDRRMSTTYGRELEVIVERERAGYGAWYEVFPRSCSPDSARTAFSAIAKRAAVHRQNGF